MNETGCAYGRPACDEVLLHHCMRLYMQWVHTRLCSASSPLGCRWACEVLRRGGPWRVFDACPTYACLPHVAARLHRLTPGAKLIFMVSSAWLVAQGGG
jgi:hypothetical protein